MPLHCLNVGVAVKWYFQHWIESSTVEPAAKSIDAKLLQNSLHFEVIWSKRSENVSYFMQLIFCCWMPSVLYECQSILHKRDHKHIIGNTLLRFLLGSLNCWAIYLKTTEWCMVVSELLCNSLQNKDKFVYEVILRDYWQTCIALLVLHSAKFVSRPSELFLSSRAYSGPSKIHLHGEKYKFDRHTKKLFAAGNFLALVVNLAEIHKPQRMKSCFHSTTRNTL